MKLWRRTGAVAGAERSPRAAPANGAPASSLPHAPPLLASSAQRPASESHRKGLVQSLRRFLVIQSLMLWQGGFLFYTTFVVPTGTEVLGSSAAQGSITARVTESLNLIGMASIGLLAWDLAATRDPCRRRTAARWWCWAALFVCQYLLLSFHQLLIALMDPSRMHVVIRPPFYPVHRLYLWASTLQWFAAVVLVWWTLRAWRAESAGSG